MNKRPIRLVISDIDGTILNDQHQVDYQLKTQLPLLQEKGIHWLATMALLSSKEILRIMIF